MTISIREARRILLQAQGLAEPWDLPPDAAGSAQLIERLSYVQIDTIHIVERAHHHTLWTRQPGYRPERLHELLTERRQVFEYWTHAASYLPMSQYRYYLPRMRAAARRESTRQRLEGHRETISLVRERIRAEGPLSAADFEAPAGFTSGWWQRKPAKVALELLFDLGELMIHERRNFQRVYDLTERVLPEGLDTREPSPDELRRFLAREVLRTRGLTDDRNLRGWLSGSAFNQAMRELIDGGEAATVQVEGQERPYYALVGALERLAEPAVPSLVHILSPFDNLIIHRQRIDDLFSFVYRLECYLPEAKRRYGYFCLPMLWGDRFIGRLDAKADRLQGTFRVRHMALDPTMEPEEPLLAALGVALHRLAAFNGCAHTVVERAEPRGWLDLLLARW